LTYGNAYSEALCQSYWKCYFSTWVPIWCNALHNNDYHGQDFDDLKIFKKITYKMTEKI
jgi:hypothetical protein